MSINVKRLFSCSHLLLSHIHSQLCAQSTHTLLCLGVWSKCNLVMDDDVKKVTELQEVQLEDGWDCIIIN